MKKQQYKKTLIPSIMIPVVLNLMLSGAIQAQVSGDTSGIVKITTAAPAVEKPTAEKAGKSEQTISVTMPGEVTLGEKNIVVSASASSGLPVTLISADTMIVNIVNGKLVARSVGITSIIARQTGNDQFAAAPDIVNALLVKEKTPVSGTAAASRSSIGTRTPILIAAATAAAVVTGVVLAVIFTNGSNDDDNAEPVDRPPNDPVLGVH